MERVEPPHREVVDELEFHRKLPCGGTKVERKTSNKISGLVIWFHLSTDSTTFLSPYRLYCPTVRNDKLANQDVKDRRLAHISTGGISNARPPCISLIPKRWVVERSFAWLEKTGDCGKTGWPFSQTTAY